MELSRPLSTVTPTLDGDVLGVLALQEVAFTTGQLHRVLGRFSEEGIRRVLLRLTKQGVVQAERVGNAFSYQLNRDHLAAPHIIGLASIQATLLARIEDRLTSWEVPAVYAAVFGSAARGQMTVDSDLDLLLVRPDDLLDDVWEAQVDNLIIDVTRWIGNDTRPFQVTVGELRERTRDEPILHGVLESGLTVAGTRAWLSKVLRKGEV